MTRPNQDRVMSAQDLRKTPEEIARNGWSVVLPGDVFHAIDEVLIKILRDAPRDSALRKYMEEVHKAMLLSAKPVQPKKRLIGLPV